ncbi:MAG: SMP-30/gluconolactonase/LRE family protein [Pseudomonadota bacterium]|jgi:glucose/arabinose dehydrogenase
MKTVVTATFAALLLAGTSAVAQQAPTAPQPFTAGTPLGVTAEGKHTPMSSNVKVHGAIVSAESCSYDPTRKLIMAVNRGASQKEAPNDGFVSLINHDGSVHTSRWIGVNRNGLVLNQPFGSDVHDGKLYLADSDGDTADGAKRVSVIRMFDLKTGTPAGEIASPDVAWLNDIEVAADGTIYGSQTGTADAQTPWRIYRITPDGRTSIFLEGAPLSRPNGVAIDKDGNIVVVNIGDDSVLTFSPSAKLLKTEHAAQAGNDGLVIMPDGTKYVSSVVNGGISRIRPGQAATLIAAGIPSAASMCLDVDANQLVVPMNANNALAFVKL